MAPVVDLESAILISDDIVPRFEDDTRPVDHATLKAQTLLNDRLYFDLPAAGQENIAGAKLLYEDLLRTVKNEAPKRWKELRNIWQPLPYGFNTSVNRQAFTAVEYGPESDMTGFTYLDYFMSTALNQINSARTGDPSFSKTQYNAALHAAWVWCARGIGFATSDPCLFESIGLFVRSGRKIRFDGEPENIDEVLKAVRQWKPGNDHLFQQESPTKIFEWLIPDFGRLSWDQILYMRSYRMHNSFREWYEQQQVRLGNPAVRVEMSKEIDSKLWKLARDVQPNIKQTTVTALLGNLPTGPIPFNPIGLASSVRDVVTEAKRKRAYGWLFWLAEARGLASSSSNS